MCNIFVHPGGVGFSGFRGRILQCKGRGIQGGLRPLSELCFGTSEI